MHLTSDRKPCPDGCGWLDDECQCDDRPKAITKVVIRTAPKVSLPKPPTFVPARTALDLSKEEPFDN